MLSSKTSAVTVEQWSAFRAKAAKALECAQPKFAFVFTSDGQAALAWGETPPDMLALAAELDLLAAEFRRRGAAIAPETEGGKPN